MSPALFEERLKRHLRIKVELIINNNRSTMLNLLYRSCFKARLSLHKMFLDAPEEVVSAIAHFIRGTRKNKKHYNALIRSYIQENLPRLDYSSSIATIQQGSVYNLASIYEMLNQHYFENALDLQITWFGTKERKARSQITFGQYIDQLKLIKINRILDDPFFPDFFVSFIVYHEMVHHVVPVQVDANKRCRYHGPAFKEKERQFAHYAEAIAWEKQHKNHFFKAYGRT